jgi:hypothetical protein
VTSPYGSNELSDSVHCRLFLIIGRLLFSKERVCFMGLDILVTCFVYLASMYKEPIYLEINHVNFRDFVFKRTCLVTLCGPDMSKSFRSRYYTDSTMSHSTDRLTVFQTQ